MWDILLKIHEQKSVQNVLLMTQRFHEYKMASTDTVAQYIAKVRNMAAQLGDVGEKVSDVMVIAKV